jgi:hypothetical protein
MTRWTTLVPVSTVGALLLLHAPVQAQTTPAPLPVSLERIRAGLRQPPPALRVVAPPAGVPTFRVEVEQFWNDRPVEEEVFDPTYGLPSVGDLMMGGIGKIRSAAVGYKQRRTKRKARQEVADALAAFCAVHECPSTGARK